MDIIVTIIWDNFPTSLEAHLAYLFTCKRLATSVRTKLLVEVMLSDRSVNYSKIMTQEPNELTP